MVLIIRVPIVTFGVTEVDLVVVRTEVRLVEVSVVGSSVLVVSSIVVGSINTLDAIFF